MGCGASGATAVQKGEPTKQKASELKNKQQQQPKYEKYQLAESAILIVKPGTSEIHDLTENFLASPVNFAVESENPEFMKKIAQQLTQDLQNAKQIYIITDIGIDASLKFLALIFPQVDIGDRKGRVYNIVVTPTITTEYSFNPTAVSSYRLAVTAQFLEKNSQNIHFIERGFWYSYGLLSHERALDKLIQRKDNRNFHPDGANTLGDIQLYFEKVTKNFFSRRAMVHILVGSWLSNFEMDHLEGEEILKGLFTTLQAGTPVMEINKLGDYRDGIVSNTPIQKSIVTLGNLSQSLSSQLKSKPKSVELSAITSENQSTNQYLAIIDMVSVNKEDLLNLSAIIQSNPNVFGALLFPQDSSKFPLCISTMWHMIEYLGVCIVLKDADNENNKSRCISIIDSLLNLNNSWNDITDHSQVFPRIQFLTPFVGQLEESGNEPLTDFSVRDVIGINQEVQVPQKSLMHDFPAFHSFRVSSSDGFVGGLISNYISVSNLLSKLVADQTQFAEISKGTWKEEQIQDQFQNVGWLLDDYQYQATPIEEGNGEEAS